MNGIDQVDEWLNVPEVAELLRIDMSRVRGLLHERQLVGVKRGERSIFSIPAAFFVPAHLANPANPTEPRFHEDGADHYVILGALRGTFIVLTDVGLSDEEIIAWLFTPEESIGTSPIEALRAGRKSEVRRVAQAML